MKINIANISLSDSQRGSDLRLKCVRICLAARLHPDPLGTLSAPLDPQAAMRGVLLREEGRVEKEGKVGVGVRRGKGRGRKGGKGSLRLNRTASTQMTSHCVYLRLERIRYLIANAKYVKIFTIQNVGLKCRTKRTIFSSLI